MSGVDARGYPLDPNHHWYTGHLEATSRQGWSIPHYVRRSGIRVHLVCGPPASGKTTYVRQRCNPGDIVIDLDDYKQTHGGRWSDDPRIVQAAFRDRDRAIHGLADATTGEAWLIVCAPTLAERVAWQEALGNVVLHVMSATKADCIRNIMSDRQRSDKRAHLDVLEAWFRDRD